METVAQMANVSMMTVSRVLNGKSNVHPKTRKRVEDTMRKIGYMPNSSARSLASSKNPFIGLPYLNPSSGYLGQLLIGALSETRKKGMHVLLEACSENPSDWAEELVAFCNQSQLSGLLLPPPLCDDPAVLEAVSQLNLRSVRVSPSRHEVRFTSVRIDEFQAAYEMTCTLIANGHSDIGFLKGPENQDGAIQRYAGFEKAMTEAGLAINHRWIKSGDFSPGPAREVGKGILSLVSRPTAIFASNDDMAAGLYTAALETGLSIPQDLSIVGFDDQPIAISLWPSLTTVNQPIIDMAAKAVSIIAAQSANSPQPRDIIFPFEILMRDSLAKPLKTRQSKA
ncbi:MAG: LacI family DNA-binding transcriptional regulator [Pseudomonadota bacterium]